MRFPQKKTVWAAASVLAAAAVLMLAINVPLRWGPAGAGTDSRLADLAAAVRGERTVEARLTGGFSYGPMRAAVRSGGSSAASDNWTLLAAAGKIREDAATSPTAANLHALGVAHLLLGEYDLAVRAFEDAITESPEEPQYLSDLAAAYMARGRQLDRPDDFPRALDASERAVKASDAMLEARFNRALALEALFLNDQARAAWEDYLSRDGSSGWASEARSHLQKLQQAPAPGDLARNNSPPPITNTSVEAGLDWVLRQGLPQWADAVLASEFERATREHLRLTDYAKQLTDISGDPFAVDLVDESTRVSRDSAQAVRAFARGLAALEMDDTATAEAAFAVSCDVASVPMAVLCNANRGAIGVLQRKDGEAEHRASTALRIATEHGWIYAANVAKRLVGYRLLFKGDYAGTSVPYQEAFQGFQGAKYLAGACQIALQLADLSDLVGLFNHGWRWRVRGLELAATSQAPHCAYLGRMQLASATAKQRFASAASVISESLDASSLVTLSDLRRVALGVIKGRIADAADEREKLRAIVTETLAMAQASPDFRARRLAPELLLLNGTLLYRDGQFEAARQTLTAAMDQMGPERTGVRASALVARARVAAEDSGHVDDAARDLNAAIKMLELRVGSGPTEPLRLEEAAVAFQTIAAVVKQRPALEGADGAWLVERVREVLNGVPQSTGTSQSMLEAALDRLQDRAVVVSFLLSANSVLAWVRTAESWEFVERAVPPEKIRLLLNTLSVQVNRTPAREDLWRPTLSELYELLLRDLPNVAGATELTIVPDGILNRVPFGALFDSAAGGYLFERAAVRIAPNLAFALVAVESTQTPATAAVVGDPRVTGAAARQFRPLPRARQEAQAVARLYAKATVVVAEQATKARVLDALKDVDVIHYAGHAVAVDQQGPRLVLAGNVADPHSGLSPADFARRFARPVRVVLAACETGATSSDRAAGLSSLSSALLRAGAVSVVATLWDVDDAASERFFFSLHQGLAAGQSTASAVARAQRACRADAECRRAAAVWIGTNAYGAN